MKYDYSQALANITKVYNELNNIMTGLEYDLEYLLYSYQKMDEVEKADKFILERVIKKLYYATEYIRSAKVIANVRSANVIADK